MGKKHSILKNALLDIYLLMKKNLIVQFRHPISTFFETIVPSLLVLLVAILRTQVKVTDHEKPTIYKEFDLIPKIEEHNYFIVFSPINNITENIMMELVNDLKKRCLLSLSEIETSCLFKYKINKIGFNSSEEMVDYYHHNNRKMFIFCGIEFGKLDEKNIEFTLRFSNIPRSFNQKSLFIEDWKTNVIMKEVLAPGPREADKKDGGIPGYAREGFLYIQHLLSLTIAKVLYGESNLTIPEKIELKSRRFPYPKYIEDSFLFMLNFIFPSIFMFSFMFASINLTKAIVNEKEKRLKESMKMMGLKEKFHWIAHFLKSIIFTFPGIILIIIFLKIQITSKSPPILISDASILFVYFFLYEISNICFCFMISTFFSKANLAAIMTGFIFFITYLPYNNLILHYNKISSLTKIFNCFLPNTNMALGIFIILMRESRGVAATWNNVAQPAISNDNLTLLFIFFMNFVNSFIYLIVTWYVTLAFPGQYGVPLPWYFPFTKKYWFNRNRMSNRNENTTQIDLDYIEVYPSNLPVGIHIENLSKTYDNGKTYSVKNLNLDIFQNQITVLLGHNGAGKTTTISLLCGLFPPTSGTAIIDGFNIKNEMNKIRSSLGICPQSNLLFDELTVKEHLEFYCKLKHTNLTDQQIKKEVKIMVKKIDLSDKFNVSANKLSGGMKRKLSIGIALIGGSKIVILDEPTSGMDVSARRFIWDLLLQEKKNKVIIISTHFMEEADILGDRIAIMDGGQLRCHGSPLFLKNRFGSGYHLRMEKKSSDIETNEITKIVYDHIPNAKLESSVGIEVSYSLPSDQIAHFKKLLSLIETDLTDKIVNYGISITTMEEVFLKVGSYNQIKTELLTMTNTNDETTNGDLEEELFSKRNTGIILMVQQFYALIVKRLIYLYRSPLLVLSQFVLSWSIIIITITMLRARHQNYHFTKLELSLQQFQNPLVKYFVFKNNLTLELSKTFATSLKKELGKERVIEISNVNDSTIINEILSVNNYAYNYEFFISALFSYVNDSLKVVSLFNNQPYHTPAISLKYIDQALIGYIYNKSDLQLRVFNYPLPMTFQEEFMITKSISRTPGETEIIQSIIMSLSFFVSSFAILIVKERVVKVKHLQKIFGLRMAFYWISLYIIDFILYLFAITLILLTIKLFKVEHLYEGQQTMYLFIGYTICGFAILPFVYVASFMFSVPATSYSRLSLLLLLTCITSMTADQLTSIEKFDLMNLNRALKPIFQIFIPLYDINKITMNVQKNYKNHKICNLELEGQKISISQLCNKFLPKNFQNMIRPCCKDYCQNNCLNYEQNYFSLTEPGIGLSLIYITISAVIYWILLIMLELNMFDRLKIYIRMFKQKFSKYNEDKESYDKNIDEDVLKEKNFINNIVSSGNVSKYSLVIKNLMKRYGKFTAVDDISYCVNRGECFGLLGINGAGKTTTFKMITCDESITSGDIFVNGYNVVKDKYKTLRSIGYCPQFDALIDELTGEETLRYFSRLRGIKEKDILGQIKELSSLLYFEMYLNKMSGKYSGGNKRKLSTAIALLGNPTVSFLDEPTTGVDPVARRCLWKAIGKKLKQNLSIVLTSHSMEECEALCNRLVIMVNGQICCIGSPLQLKRKYGNSYNLLIKVSLTKFDDEANNMEKSTTTNSIDTKKTSFTMTNDFESIHYSRLEEQIKNVQKFISKAFPTSELKAIHNHILEYTIHINNQNHRNNHLIRCSDIFHMIEMNKKNLMIEDYSVSQTNLEQIFLSFARNQRD